MNAASGLTFLPTTMMLVLAALMLTVAGVLCWTAWRRSGYRKATGVLELLRFVVLALVAATLCQPEWVSVESAEENSTLAVLVDVSQSMQTRDVLEVEGAPKSRAEALEPLLAAEVWNPVAEDVTVDLDVVFESFSSSLDTPELGTDLNAGLMRVLEAHSALRGVVVLSDGDWNVGGSPTLAATQYRLAGVPVFGVCVGSEEPLPDLELAAMDAPTFGVLGKPLRIPFVVKSTLGKDRELTVTLDVDGAPAAVEPVLVPAMGEVQASLVWIPMKTGDFTIEMRVPPDDEELFRDNNSLVGPIAVREEQLQILVIESYPRWEYRYLRNALERDPGVEVTCLLFHPELAKVGGGRSYIEEFPSEGELSRFDVVFLGDVGLDPKQLALEDTVLLKALVSAQAAGLVFLPGRYGFQETLSASPLGDLLPVVMDSARPTGVGSSAPGHFKLTQAGRQSLLTRLDESDSINTEIWRKLPGFHWYAGVVRAKVGTEVLAVHERDTSIAGRIPLLVTKTYGTGKVLFMGSDGAWRWREGVEDRFHYRFWAQVARWMAYRRQMADGQSIRLFFTPDRPAAREVVTLNANVLDAMGGPLTAGTVVVQTISPTGKTKTVRLEPGSEDAWGLFSGSFSPTETGNYRLVATCAETGANVQADLSVQGQNLEQLGRVARLDVLAEISSITRGRTIRASEVGSLLADLRKLPEPEPTLHRTKIWSHPAWCGLLIFLLGAFWTGRKFIGAV